MKLHQCPCCDHFSLSSRGEYEICAVCFWEDEGLDLADMDEHSGPNRMSLRQARQNFIDFGACEREMRKHVLPENERSVYDFQRRGAQP